MLCARFGRRPHLVGACGTGMASLGRILHQAGHRVTGSDAAAPETGVSYPLQTGHAAAHLPPDADQLIYSGAVPSDNPERQAATERGVPQMAYADAVAALLHDDATTRIAIAGTHGKSTVAALVAHLLQHAGRRPTYLFGAAWPDGAAGGQLGDGRLALVEACEQDRKFLQLRPTHAVVTSIEPDHFDCFATSAELDAAFQAFVDRLPSDGVLVVERSAAARLDKTPARVATYALDEASFALPQPASLPGVHNRANVLGAVALAREVGLTEHEIAAALPSFPGLRRRFERRTLPGGVIWIDDYAHHPTAIRAVLAAARAEHPTAWLVALFEPHQAGRLRRLLDDFAAALAGADAVGLLPIHHAREPQPAAPDNLLDQLAAQLTAHGVPLLAASRPDDLPAAAVTTCRAGDVVVTMSASKTLALRQCLPD